MFSQVSNWIDWGSNKTYRATGMNLEQEDDSSATLTPTTSKPPEEAPTPSSEELPTTSENSEAVTESAGGSWWFDYSKITQNIDVSKLKEKAQNFDYKKVTEKIGENLNRETVNSATKGIGNYLSNVYGDIVTSVENMQKDGIPILTEFEEEQKKFMKMQSRRHGAAIPPWVGYVEEEKMKKQILALSTDERNVLREPPAGVDYIFDLESNMPIATAVLEADPKLDNLRFKLVPKIISEEKFWRNYFYRVSLIKQSAQLSSLEDNEKKKVDKVPSTDDIEDNGYNQDEDEFVSDHVGEFEDAKDELSQSDLEAMGLRRKEGTDTTAEWESELARELQDFDMVNAEDVESRIDAESFEAELEEMLQNQ